MSISSFTMGNAFKVPGSSSTSKEVHLLICMQYIQSNLYVAIIVIALTENLAAILDFNVDIKP